MTDTAVSERDLAVLRSFARRIDPSDAGAHNNLGVLYFRRGLTTEAAHSFARALELDPRMTVAQRNMEIVHRHTGHYDRRIAELRERLRQRTGDRDARFELGRAYASVGQLEEALAEFETIVTSDSGDLGALLQLGLVEQRRGNLDQSLEWLSRARERDPESSVVEFHRGEVLYNRGMNQESLAALQRSVGLNPDNAEAQHLLAFVFGDMGRHAEAREASKRASQLNPSLAKAQSNLSLEVANGRPSMPGGMAPPPEAAAQPAQGAPSLAHFNLGHAFRQKGYFNEALREYRLALERGEDRFQVRQGMAELHILRHDLPAALEVYDELVRERPDTAKLWNERGVVLHQLGRGEEALASYRRSIAADDGYALSYNNLGVALATHGKLDDAVEALRMALRHRGDLLQARLNLALLLAQLRRFQPALEAYRQALESVPDSVAAWNGVGQVLVELKRHQDAKNAFARAVEADPDNAPAHYNLSFTLSNLGDFEGALREVRRALELDPYYATQKFLLSIELQADDPALAVIPDLSGERTFGEGAEEFVFDQRLLDDIFAELKPAPASSPRPAGEDPFALARDYLSKALFERALAEVGRAVQRGADAAEGAVMLGAIYARRSLHGEALDRFREARTLDPSHRAARTGEVRALLALGRAQEARPLAEELMTAYPDDVDATMMTAEARAATGDPAGAVDLLHRAEVRAPARADVRRLLGDVALKVGDTDLARASYAAALQLDPGYAEVWLEIGRLCQAKGELKEAERSYRAALDRLPSFADAAHALAALFLDTERPADALDGLVVTLERDPYDFEALVLLARALMDLNRPADAGAAAARVVRFRPDHVAANYQLGVALARERRYREAAGHWQRCISLDPSGPFAAKARMHARTALDLVHIFSGEAT